MKHKLKTLRQKRTYNRIGNTRNVYLLILNSNNSPLVNYVTLLKCNNEEDN